ncbi:MAG TPA: VCBS repeat-containing protein, partial [Balneolaceae bacterium]
TLPPAYYEIENDIIDLQCADLNKDGWNDMLVSVGYSPARFEIWINRGDLTFEDATADLAPNGSHDNWAWRLPVVDFNGDDWPDFFVSTIDENDRIYINQGGTGYTVLNPPDNMNNLMPIDANGDGRTDFYWAGATADDGTEYEPVFFRNQ